MSEYHECLRNGKVKAGDDFNDFREVLRLFGIDPEGHDILHEREFAIPHLKGCVVSFWGDRSSDGWRMVREGSGKFDPRGWEGAKSVTVSNRGVKHMLPRAISEYMIPRKHYVFYKMASRGATWWKFHGVFEASADLEPFAESIRYVRISADGKLREPEAVEQLKLAA